MTAQGRGRGVADQACVGLRSAVALQSDTAGERALDVQQKRLVRAPGRLPISSLLLSLPHHRGATPTGTPALELVVAGLFAFVPPSRALQRRGKGLATTRAPSTILYEDLLSERLKQ
jgi:hypothetical protein